jgi:hypothetical protein
MARRACRRHDDHLHHDHQHHDHFRRYDGGLLNSFIAADSSAALVAIGTRTGRARFRSSDRRSASE